MVELQLINVKGVYGNNTISLLDQHLVNIFAEKKNHWMLKLVDESMKKKSMYVQGQICLHKFL